MASAASAVGFSSVDPGIPTCTSSSGNQGGRGQWGDDCWAVGAKSKTWEGTCNWDVRVVAGKEDRGPGFQSHGFSERAEGSEGSVYLRKEKLSKTAVFLEIELGT